jgi:hypothetical protein
MEYLDYKEHYRRQTAGIDEGKKAVTVSTLAQRLHERRAAHRRARALERVLARVPEGTMREEILAIASRQS